MTTSTTDSIHGGGLNAHVDSADAGLQIVYFQKDVSQDARVIENEVFGGIPDASTIEDIPTLLISPKKAPVGVIVHDPDPQWDGQL